MCGILLRTQPDFAAFVAGNINGAALQVQLAARRFDGDAACAEFTGSACQQLRALVQRHAVTAGDANRAAIRSPGVNGAADADTALIGAETEVFHRGRAIEPDVALADAELA